MIDVISKSGLEIGENIKTEFIFSNVLKLNKRKPVCVIHLSSKWINNYYSEDVFIDLLKLLEERNISIYLTSDETTKNKFSKIFDIFPVFNNPKDLLKNNENIGTDQKDTLKVNYRRGDWGASLTALRVGELLDNGVKGDNGEIYLIPSMTTANLSVYKKFTLKGNDARLRLMVRNIADERAPLADGWFGFYSDIHRDDGRHYYLDLRMDF